MNPQMVNLNVLELGIHKGCAKWGLYSKDLMHLYNLNNSTFIQWVTVFIYRRVEEIDRLERVQGQSSH